MFLLQNQIDILVIIILYNAFMQKMVEHLYSESNTNDQIQNTSQLLFIIGCFSVIFFKLRIRKMKKNKNKNKKIITGLYYGNIILVLYTAINNWYFLSDQTKLLLFSLSFCIFISYSYFFNN